MFGDKNHAVLITSYLKANLVILKSK